MLLGRGGGRRLRGGRPCGCGRRNRTDPEAEMHATNLAGAENVLAQQSTPGVIRRARLDRCGTVPVPDRSVTAEHLVVGAENGYGQTACERYARSLQDAGHPVVMIYPSGIVGLEDWNESINLNSVKLWIEKGFPSPRATAAATSTPATSPT